MSAIEKRKRELLHRAVTYFEDAPCYELAEVLKLHSLHGGIAYGKKGEDEAELDKFEKTMESLVKKADAPERVYLWKKGNIPSTGAYKENVEQRFNHDPEFEPYMYELLIADDIEPKGAVVVCAGGDHGDCTMHEGYQTCIEMNKLGYQCFLLLNRTNMCPYDAKEAGADAARAIQLVRKNSKRYRIDENKVVFAGFSNGGLTAEACIQYYSGTQSISTHFADYVPDEVDEYYGSPEAVICVYGPRFKDATFDYTNVVYPPTFFAVGREDSAMDNLRAVYADLKEHHVEIEIHTFAGVPHGQSGVQIYGEEKYSQFQLWPVLADAFVQNVFAKSVIKRRPDVISDMEYRYDSFKSGNPVLNKKKGHLPAMGWNSWNAFGSGNTEALTKDMADAIVELGLDRLGYEYIVLDDGCYKPERVDGKLSNEDYKFPNGFRALSDYIHEKGLKFGMYNDIGTNLCAGAAVGTCGHEMIDSQSYIDWGVDFIKVDNCYYLWDNATFSDAANAKYVYAPNIAGIAVSGKGIKARLSAVTDGQLTGEGASIVLAQDIHEELTEESRAIVKAHGGYATCIGTFDGTGPDNTPVGAMSGELVFKVNVPETDVYNMTVDYATDCKVGAGSWLEIAVGYEGKAEIFYDDFMTSTGGENNFKTSQNIQIKLNSGENIIRLMNHRRQENTLCSYAALLEGLNKADPEHDMIFSICEWGKTQPQNWGYKVGDSWRILNDITFRVGADGDPGHGSWIEGYTTSVTSQYNKAVIMDEFAGLDKGWNDPDMLMIGMNGMDITMCRTHMTMWCMMNSPLMLGMDLRRVKKGDEIYNIISNDKVIALNQDSLGIQAKRVFTSIETDTPDKTYIRENERVDILAKPLSDGGVAISFINVNDKSSDRAYSIDIRTIADMLGDKLVNVDALVNADSYDVTDIWTGENSSNTTGIFEVGVLQGCDNLTIKVMPK